MNSPMWAQKDLEIGIGDSMKHGLKLGGKETNETKLLRQVAEDRQDEEPRVFPKSFLVALRMALDSGMSCEQVTSSLILMSTFHSLSKSVDQEILLERVQGLCHSIRATGAG